MPKKLDDPAALSMAEIAKLSADDPRAIAELQQIRSEPRNLLAPYYDEIKQHFPWFDSTSRRSWMRLHSTCSLKLQKPVDWWLDAMDFEEFLGAVEAIAGEETADDVQTVRLSQCAGIVNRSKRTLERWKTDDTEFPTPEVIGEGGKPDEWKWATIRGYLERKCNRKLPASFPSLSR